MTYMANSLIEEIYDGQWEQDERHGCVSVQMILHDSYLTISNSLSLNSVGRYIYRKDEGTIYEVRPYHQGRGVCI